MAQGSLQSKAKGKARLDSGDSGRTSSSFFLLPVTTVMTKAWVFWEAIARDDMWMACILLSKKRLYVSNRVRVRAGVEVRVSMFF